MEEDPPANYLCDISSYCQDLEDVSEEEIQWMMSRRCLEATEEALAHDYNAQEAKEMVKAFDDVGISHLLGILRWPGIGTRWRPFVKWIQDGGRSRTMLEAFSGFARFLGRVTTYRALSLDSEGLQRILEAGEIFPRGQLDVDAAKLAEVIERHGVVKVVVARLYIAHLKRLIGHDPSVSLHDDWQTTSCIASGYMGSGKQVHLFEVSVPVVESLGLRLSEVEVNAEAFLGPKYRPTGDGWFCFQAPAFPEGVYFDRTVQRTERYGLYSVPFLKRLRRMWKFPSPKDVGLAITPFALRQADMQKKHPRGCGPLPYLQ